MSSYLWKYYLEDDVDRFRHLLETASYNVRNTAQKGGGSTQNIMSSAQLSSSPGILGSSPAPNSKGRKLAAHGQGGTPGSGSGGLSLTRADINWRDSSGLTLLHHASSSTSENALAFAQALVDHPLTDLYLQDFESGWTALHRAFYFGNITIAKTILERDAEISLGRAVGSISHNALGLIKIKDREGLGPLDLYAVTIQDRTLHGEKEGRTRSGSNASSDAEQFFGDNEDEEGNRRRYTVAVDSIAGDECFTFGSNRNITLGFGDEDDRQWPEKVTLKRPDHLLQRFYKEHTELQEKTWSAHEPSNTEGSVSSLRPSLPVESLPWIIKSRPLVIQDVHMSKLHTAVLTTDPESNLFMCGHGPGGRLGLGHERTQFTFACIEGGALTGKKVASVALGQNHSLALSDEGEVFSWGSNGSGQLGYALPANALRDQDPVQTVPRQIFGPLKREIVVGIAASRIHSVAYTSSSLYTWGRNEGQLGLVDSDARSLEVQVTPRKVAASLFTSPIASVSAVDKATVCLLSSTHECWVFANYGYAKIQFPLDGFSNYFLKQSFLVTRYNTTVNHLVKITAAGDTICAMSSNGEIYSLSVSQPQVMQASTSSTTNPAKIKGALSSPHCVWSLKKNNMAARDVGVDADGSIMITTEEGSVWKRSRRAKIKDALAPGSAEYRAKDYKFSRVSGLTRIIGVKASGYGSYAAIRRDCDVTKTQIAVEEPTLWRDLLPLLCFRDLSPAAVTPDSEKEEPEPRFWQGRKQSDDLLLLKQQLLLSKDLEKELDELLRVSDASAYDAVMGSTVSDLRLPIHHFLLAGRSRVLREGWHSLRHGKVLSIPDLLIAQTDAGGKTEITFQGIDPLALVNFVLYLYTDNVVDYWHHTRRSPRMAHRYRQVRTEMMRMASGLKMQNLEAAVRQMVEPVKSLNMDMEVSFRDATFFDQTDVVVQLADEDVHVHSALVCQRCPFFEGLFMGRAGGRWIAERRTQLSEPDQTVKVDLKHIESNVFRLVLRHIYADTGEELFDDVVSADLDDFLDLVTEVMGVANELMLDRLAQICQKIVGRFVNVRNVASLLNAIAPSSVTEFKDASLEYMCLSLEAILHGGLLDELDEDLLQELDDIVRDIQLACLPFAKSGRAEQDLFERNPGLAETITRNKRAKIDAINIHSKYQTVDNWASSSFRGHSMDEQSSSPTLQRARRKSSKEMKSPGLSPALRGKAGVEVLGTSIGEETVLDLGAPAIREGKEPESRLRSKDSFIGSPPTDIWYNHKGKTLSTGDALPIDLPSTHATPAKSPRLAPSPSTPASSSAAPWAATASPGSKLDMKDIMAQASFSRVSNLSLGLAASRQKHEPSSAAQLGGKMSQKERKRIQQQHQAVVAEPAPQAQSSPAAKESPWQRSSAQKIPSLKDVMSTETQPGSSPVQKPAVVSSSPTPQLTMRQTIANPRPSPSPKPSNISGSSPQQPQRSQSGSIASKPKAAAVPSPRPAPSPQQGPIRQTIGPARPSHSSSNTKPAANFSSSPADFPTIQSVRHQPRPVEPSLQLSMADILAQQALEKEIIKEAAAARSLQDIQAEQEFQQWWDLESKRYQEQSSNDQGGEGSRDAETARRGGRKSARGRRGGSRGGGNIGERGKGGPPSTGKTGKDNAAARGGHGASHRGRGT